MTSLLLLSPTTRTNDELHLAVNSLLRPSDRRPRQVRPALLLPPLQAPPRIRVRTRLEALDRQQVRRTLFQSPCTTPANALLVYRASSSSPPACTSSSSPPPLPRPPPKPSPAASASVTASSASSPLGRPSPSPGTTRARSSRAIRRRTSTSGGASRPSQRRPSRSFRLNTSRGSMRRLRRTLLIWRKRGRRS